MLKLRLINALEVLFILSSCLLTLVTNGPYCKVQGAYGDWKSMERQIMERYLYFQTFAPFSFLIIEN